ncbi:MAG: penicillin acylase family protein, partial [Myxococcota bacterium]|nr:penicillin acylase family protein [Myxococcota bacterium]
MTTFTRQFTQGLMLALALAPFAASCDDDSVDALEAISIDETIRLNDLSAPVRVYRTELNVPHIYATNALDRYRVMGFIMAKDRYAQIDLGRRVGQGRIGELVGSFGEEIDRQTRNRGLAEVARRLWASMSESRRAEFEAFASGINDYIAEVKEGKYDAPEEFDILRGLVGVSKPEDLMEPLSGEDLMGMTAVVVSRLGFEDTEITVTERRNSLDSLFEGLPNEEQLYGAFMGAIWNDITPYHKLAEAPGFGLNGEFGQP